MVANRVVDSYDMPRLPAYSPAGPRRVCCCCLLLSVASLAFVPSAVMLSSATTTTTTTTATETTAATTAVAPTLRGVAASALRGNASDLARVPESVQQLERAALRLRQLAVETPSQAPGVTLGEQALRESNPEWSVGVHANNPLMIDVAHAVGWLVNRARTQR